MHDAESIARANAINRELDEQSECAYLTVHDTIEREIIEGRVMRRLVRIAEELQAVYADLQEWRERDDRENPIHARINARARERARQLDTTKPASDCRH